MHGLKMAFLGVLDAFGMGIGSLGRLGGIASQVGLGRGMRMD